MEMKNIPFGTAMKMTELVLVQAVYGWNAEKLHMQFPCLTLGRIYFALASSIAL